MADEPVKWTADDWDAGRERLGEAEDEIVRLNATIDDLRAEVARLAPVPVTTEELAREMYRAARGKLSEGLPWPPVLDWDELDDDWHDAWTTAVLVALARAGCTARAEWEELRYRVQAAAELKVLRGRYAALSEAAGAMTAENAKLARGGRTLGDVVTLQSRTLMAAWIDAERGDHGAAREHLAQATEDVLELHTWDGKETGAEWLERTRGEDPGCTECGQARAVHEDAFGRTLNPAECTGYIAPGEPGDDPDTGAGDRAQEALAAGPYVEDEIRVGEKILHGPVCECGHKKGIHAGYDATGRCVRRSCWCPSYAPARDDLAADPRHDPAVERAAGDDSATDTGIRRDGRGEQ